MKCAAKANLSPYLARAPSDGRRGTLVVTWSVNALFRQVDTYRETSVHKVGILRLVLSRLSPSMPLMLTRHGQTNWNDERRVQGQDDTSRLTDLGREQAQTLGASLVGAGITHIMASDLSRARETASIVSATLGVDVGIDSRLRERSYGIFEGQPLSTLTSDVTGIRDNFLVDPDARPTGGESFRDVAERAREFLDGLTIEPSAHLLLVTHGGTIRALLAVNANAPLTNLPWERVDNCSQWAMVLA